MVTQRLIKTFFDGIRGLSGIAARTGALYGHMSELGLGRVKTALQGRQP
jgi:hypothetical protein